jgi:lipopolysaccharide transport system ATP-binding protein
MSETLIKVENVSKKFCKDLKRSLWYGLKDLGSEIIGQPHDHARQLRKDEFWAAKDISFELKRGECLGLIGPNGAGKTTLLRLLNGLLKADEGRIEIHGRVGAIIALGAGFNPVLTGRENIYVNAAVLGLSQKEINSKFDEIVEFAELNEFIDMPVQNYSSGMQMRLGFAVATSFEPDILLLDEVLAVGDAAFRAKCYDRIFNIIQKTAVIFVSHSMVQVSRLCDIVLLMNGKMSTLYDTVSLGIRKYFELSTPNEDQATLCHSTNKVVLDSLTFKGVDGRLRSKHPAVLSFDLAIAPEIPSVTIALSVLTREKLPCAHWQTQRGQIKNLGRKQHIEFCCQQLPFVYDKYTLSIAVFNDACLEQLLWLYNVLPFIVEGNGEASPTPIELPGEWRFEGSSQEEASK